MENLLYSKYLLKIL